MPNLEIHIPAVDGSQYSIHEYGESCKLAIHTLVSDDFAAPPSHMVVEAKTESGKIVKVLIRYNHNEGASVQVDGETV